MFDFLRKAIGGMAARGIARAEAKIPQAGGVAVRTAQRIDIPTDLDATPASGMVLGHAEMAVNAPMRTPGPGVGAPMRTHGPVAGTAPPWTGGGRTLGEPGQRRMPPSAPVDTVSSGGSYNPISNLAFGAAPGGRPPMVASGAPYMPGVERVDPAGVTSATSWTRAGGTERGATAPLGPVASGGMYMPTPRNSPANQRPGAHSPLAFPGLSGGDATPFDPMSIAATQASGTAASAPAQGVASVIDELTDSGSSFQLPVVGNYLDPATPAFLKPGAKAVASNAAVDPVASTGNPLNPTNLPSTSFGSMFGAGGKAAAPIGMNFGMHVAAGAAAFGLGGATSYATGGNFIEGGAMGAGIMMGGSLALRTGSKHFANKAQRFALGGFQHGLVANGHNVNARRAMFASGAMLGGFMFGGSRSRKRGFNASRGNSIGR